MYKHIGLIRF